MNNISDPPVIANPNRRDSTNDEHSAKCDNMMESPTNLPPTNVLPLTLIRRENQLNSGNSASPPLSKTSKTVPFFTRIERSILSLHIATTMVNKTVLIWTNLTENLAEFYNARISQNVLWWASRFHLVTHFFDHKLEHISIRNSDETASRSTWADSALVLLANG